MVFASGIGLFPGQPQLRGSGASNGRGEGRTIRTRRSQRETVEQLDDFGRLRQGEPVNYGL